MARLRRPQRHHHSIERRRIVRSAYDMDVFRKRAGRNLVRSKKAFIKLYHAIGVSVFIC